MMDPAAGTGCADGCHDRGASCIIKVPSGSTSAAARVYRISNKSNTSCERCCRIWLISLYANSAVSQLLSRYKAPNSGLGDLAWCLLAWDSQPVCPYQHVLYWLLCSRSDPGKIYNFQPRKFALKQWTEINESCFACNCIPEKYIGLVHPGERELAWVQAKNPRAGRDHSGQSHCKCTDRSKRHWISNMCSYMPGKNIKQRLLHSCSSPCYLKAHTTLCLWKQPADPALHQPGWYKSAVFHPHNPHLCLHKHGQNSTC